MYKWVDLEIPEAKVFTIKLFSEEYSKELLSRAIDTTEWSQEYHNFSGKKVAFPRLTAWYGDTSYTYSGVTHQPLEFTDLILEVKKVVDAVCKREFNSVLLNYYRHKRDSVGYHSDDEPELGRNPFIASVSLGAERPLHLQHKQTKAWYKLNQPSGSLIMMAGETQNKYKHSIIKATQDVGPRVNLTFRQNKN